eukprot:7568768-Pyramimonas_sp.AAC.1
MQEYQGHRADPGPAAAHQGARRHDASARRARRSRPPSHCNRRVHTVFVVARSMVASWSCTARPTAARQNQEGEGLRPPIALMSTVYDS